MTDRLLRRARLTFERPRRAVRRALPARVVIPGRRATHDAAECPVCGVVARRFLPYGNVRPQPDRRCPGCQSLERHRLVWLYFQHKTNLFTEPVRMLHVAPERFIQERLQAFENIDYLSADLTSPRAMEAMDITDIRHDDDSFDVIFASHVLEHIPDDERAMQELCRVLRPAGWAILEVPMWGEKTKEDPTVTDPAERARLFGQKDHVRMYGHDGVFEHRLRRSGFDVTVDKYTAELGPELTRRYRLRETEDIYLCTKAGGGRT